MERQMTLAEINDELGAARTNKKEFLEKLEAIIPWETFFELIQPSYYKGELGNKPYPLELMLRIFILQNVYNLADMAVMNEVIDSRAFSNFCGINSPIINGTGNYYIEAQTRDQKRTDVIVDYLGKQYNRKIYGEPTQKKFEWFAVICYDIVT